MDDPRRDVGHRPGTAGSSACAATDRVVRGLALLTAALLAVEAVPLLVAALAGSGPPAP
jgi:hypothetical protein